MTHFRDLQTAAPERCKGTVRAKKSKRCPGCHKMVRVGEEATLVDDRWMESLIQWHGRQYVRGAWHLWHPACWTATRKEDAL